MEWGLQDIQLFTARIELDSLATLGYGHSRGRDKADRTIILELTRG